MHSKDPDDSISLRNNTHRDGYLKHAGTAGKTSFVRRKWEEIIPEKVLSWFYIYKDNAQ